MPRNITVTLSDGTQHVYANAPDNITPDQVTQRAQKDFGQSVKALDGGRGAAPAKIAAPAPAGPPSVRNAFNLGPPPAKGTPERAAFDAEYNRRFNAAWLKANPDQARARQIAAAAQAHSAQNVGALNQYGGTAGNFLTALKAGVTRGMFGIPERLAAAGEKYLPSAITGNTTNASYDDILKVIRANTDADLGQSTAGSVAGQVVGGVATGRAAAGALGAVATRAAAASAPVVARAGNVLQSLMTVKKGQTIANAGKVILGGAAGGATQAAGEGSDPITGAEYGAAGAAVLGGGFKAAQVLTRPFRDVLRLSSAGQILSRITGATKDQLSAKADAYRAATGAEPTLFELLPLSDRNKILKQAVVGRDNVVEATSAAIRQRASRLGPEMSDRARAILAPERNTITGDMHRDLTAARGGTAIPEDGELAARAANSPTDMLALRDEESRAIMAPHENTPVVDDLHDLYPSVETTGADGSIQRVSTDPEVQAVIRSAAGTLRARPEGAGVSANEVSDMIQTLRGDLSKGGIEGRTAQRAIDHLENTLAENAPDAAAAHQQMTDAYAARSRMAEGMQEGARTQMRDDVQVGTSRKEARRVRNAYDTQEGVDGRVLGQGNRVLGGLAGSPEEALRSTVQMSRNSTGRQLSQNVGADQAEQIMAAARAQDTSAQALSSAAQMAQSGDGDAVGAETLVQALAALHPSSFITTKAGAIRKLLDMTYIPENRARTMVDMLFSQDPTMTRRALDAVGNEKNGAKFLQYLGGVTGITAGGGQDPDPTAPSAPGDVPEQPTIPGEDAGPNDGATDAAPAEEAPAEDSGPVDEASSPYAANLQQVYDTENPDLLDLIDRVSGQESGGRQHDAAGRPVTSSAGAIGVMQLMPDTAPEAARLAGVPFDENAYRNDPAYNKLLGIAYLSELLRKYDGDVAKATAAYNAGGGRVDAAVKKGGNGWLQHVPAETQDYVRKVA